MSSEMISPDYFYNLEIDISKNIFKTVHVDIPINFAPKIYYYFYNNLRMLYGDSEETLQEKSNNLHPRKSGREVFEPRCRMYNMMFGICQLLQSSHFYKPNDNTNCNVLFQILILCMINMIEEFGEQLIFMSTLEYSETNGLHFHILYLKDTKWTVSDQNKLQEIFNSTQNTKFYDNINFKWSSKLQITKSIASFINYMRKESIYFLCNSFETAITLAHFDRSMFFKEDSTPKYLQPKLFKNEQQAKQEYIQFLIDKFENGITEFGEIEKDNTIRKFLGISNYNQMYKNIFNQFCSSNTLPCLIQRMTTNFTNKYHSLCPCPVFDWLKLQELDHNDFMDAFYKWLMQTTKKNTFILQGIPNAGKSHFAQAVWQSFTIHTRLLQDGIFTFANLINSDCALWEEPLITPDNVDMCKLALEGQHNISVAIKNQASKQLTKRVPILITTNKDISTYCSSERQAIHVRSYKFICNTPIYDDMFCKSVIHTCTDIGTKGKKFSDITDTYLFPHNDSQEEQTDATHCNNIHKITNWNGESFIAFVLFKHLHDFKFLHGPDDIDFDQTVHDSILHLDNLFCEHSKYAYL